MMMRRLQILRTTAQTAHMKEGEKIDQNKETEQQKQKESHTMDQYTTTDATDPQLEKQHQQ